MVKLKTPCDEALIRSLKVGDAVEISGTLFTGRDAVHKYLHEGGELPAGVNLRNGILYHCGPVVMKDESGHWKVTAAGPTTSIREEPYQWQIIRDFGRFPHRNAALGRVSTRAERRFLRQPMSSF